MTISPAELSALPTAPTVSAALDEAARYTDDGAILALSRAVYGSTNPVDYAAFVSLEHTLAWGTALMAAARVVDPAVSSSWPDASWTDALWGDTVGRAHATVSDWADDHTQLELAELFRAAAREVRAAER